MLAGLDRRAWRPILLHHDFPGVQELAHRAEALGVGLRTVPWMKGISGLVRLPGLARRIAAERPHVFHAHLTWPLACKFGIVAAAAARVPAIVATAQLFMDLPRTRSIALQHRVMTANVDRFLAVSEEVARRWRERLGVPAAKLEVIPNGILLEPFAGAPNRPLRAAWTGSPPRPVVLTVARFDRQKGHSHLLAAAARLPDVAFVLAGDGPERYTIEADISRLGLGDRVILLGYRADVPDLLANCDLFVLPSLFEGLPLSVLEAMAAGKPVIASAIGGTDEAVVHGETGVLVPPGDAEALAAAIRLVLSDTDLAQRLGAAGAARVRERFSANRMVQRVAAVYEEILADKEKTR